MTTETINKTINNINKIWRLLKDQYIISMFGISCIRDSLKIDKIVRKLHRISKHRLVKGQKRIGTLIKLSAYEAMRNAKQDLMVGLRPQPTLNLLKTFMKERDHFVRLRDKAVEREFKGLYSNKGLKLSDFVKEGKPND